MKRTPVAWVATFRFIRLYAEKRRSPRRLGRGSSSIVWRKRPNSGKQARASTRIDAKIIIEALRSEYEGVTFRTPRLGVEGCCGRGCNGCLHFWNEPRYANARQLLRSKGQGVLLSEGEARQVKEFPNRHPGKAKPYPGS